jgi:hypothetical protein
VARAAPRFFSSMIVARQKLGDSHNFGRRVSVRAGWVRKPRAILWEWLLLGAESPLRRALHDAVQHDGLVESTFDFLPTLEFRFARSGLGGEVERLELRPLGSLSKARKRELSRIAGRALALSAFLGVADLHWENLALGLGARGSVVLAPLDVEIILSDLSLPTETKLLPDADPELLAVSRHACGLRRILPYLGKPIPAATLVEMAAAYHGTLVFLERHAKTIASALRRLPELAETPIRVCLRGTDDYVLAGSRPIWPPLLDAELEQLERGDIPYFFRLYGRAGIHYYRNRSLTDIGRLPLRGDVPRLDPLLRLSSGLGSPGRQKLREEGLFALLGALDHPTLGGRHASEALEVTFGARRLAVTLPTGERLSSPRNLSALAGSAYLPCRCGEVRSVFVPRVTRCRILPRDRDRFHL